MGVKVSLLLSPMDEPLGRAVGNALEVAECVEILQGRGPQDIVDLVLDMAEQVSTAPRAKLATWLADGTAWWKLISLVYAQDSDASSLEKITEISSRPHCSSPARTNLRHGKKMGERVEKDEPLLLVHARNDQRLRSVLPLLEQAVETG